MDAKLSFLLSTAARVAAESESSPGALGTESARRLLYDLLPQALLLQGRSDDVLGALATPSGKSSPNSFKTKAVLAALRKDLGKLGERLDAGIHVLQRADGGPGEEGARRACPSLCAGQRGRLSF